MESRIRESLVDEQRRVSFSENPDHFWARLIGRVYGQHYGGNHSLLAQRFPLISSYGGWKLATKSTSKPGNVNLSFMNGPELIKSWASQTRFSHNTELRRG